VYNGVTNYQKYSNLKWNSVQTGMYVESSVSAIPAVSKAYNMYKHLTLCGPSK